MKKLVCLTLILVMSLGASGCIGQVPEDHLYEQISSFSPEFFVHTAEVNALFIEVFRQHPEMQVYVGEVTIQSTAVRHKVKVEYKNKDIDPESIVCGTEEGVLEKTLKGALHEVSGKGAVVLLGQPEQPDPLKYVDRIKQEDYLSVMGMRSSEWTFTTNNFTDDMVVLYEFEYSAGRDELIEYREKTLSEVERLQGELWQKDTPPVMRVQAIHDYIVTKTQYPDEESSLDHTPYNVLLQGSGVCDGYTYAAHLLLRAAGIPALVATGTAGGEEHAWNVVELEGSHYHMDVTWDDPVGNHDMIIYDYFLKGDSVMKKDHSWDNDIPACPKDYQQQN